MEWTVHGERSVYESDLPSIKDSISALRLVSRVLAMIDGNRFRG